MRAHLLQLWIETRESYWFWPSIMAITAICLSLVTTAIDVRVGSDWPEQISFIYSNQPDGARALLATVAGSMITVTGITFSLTLLAVSHATGQFGPRLLTNFMRDRGNQITLGTFVATFLYCLMVLRTVQSAENPTIGGLEIGEATNAFVPHISILIALIFTIASVGVLIYFIHHIPESIRLSNVVAKVGRELLATIPHLFPESIGHEQSSADDDDPRRNLPDHFAELAVPIRSKTDGYVQALDQVGIMQLAMDRDLVIKVCTRPGDFVSRGQSLMLVSPSERATEHVCNELRFAFALGAYRTSTQNALFLVDQLVEVAARALSPGVNDPMTAMTCIDWLQSVMMQLTTRQAAQSCRFDPQGQLRIVADPVTFHDFCRSIFDQLRPYVASDRNAALHMMQMIANVLTSTRKDAYRELLSAYAEQLIEAAETHGLLDCDLSQLRGIYEECIRTRNHIEQRESEQPTATTST